MTAEIITIGDEILIGQIVDTNSAWIASKLNDIGVSVKRMVSISDNADEIVDALNQAFGRADVVIMTGGLGPTSDDRTKPTLASYFGSELILDESILKDIEVLFSTKGYVVTELNRKQAEVPACCRSLHNRMGTAPGMWFERDDKILVSLPGVPFEMKGLIEQYVLPELLKMSGDNCILHKTVLTHGVGESFLADMIKDWEESLPENISLAYLPSPGIVKLRLTALGNNNEELKDSIDKQILSLKTYVDEYIWGVDDDTFEKIVLDLLIERNQTVGTAESCTGGYISHLITSIPGSSAAYKGSVISYSNDVKISELHVDADVIDKYGAVSEQVVGQMAEGLRKRLGVDYAVATSGIAGPDGGTQEKPVGTVWIAVASNDGVISSKFTFGDNRERNIRRASLAALNMLRKKMLGLND